MTRIDLEALRASAAANMGDVLTAIGCELGRRAKPDPGLFAVAALVALEEGLSRRLRAIVRLLRARGPAGATTWELLLASRSAAVHSSVFELRARLRAIGWLIRCEREATTEGGRTVYRYTLEEARDA